MFSAMATSACQTSFVGTKAAQYWLDCSEIWSWRGHDALMINPLMILSLSLGHQKLPICGFKWTVLNNCWKDFHKNLVQTFMFRSVWIINTLIILWLSANTLSMVTTRYQYVVWKANWHYLTAHCKLRIDARTMWSRLNIFATGLLWIKPEFSASNLFGFVGLHTTCLTEPVNSQNCSGNVCFLPFFFFLAVVLRESSTC